MEQITALFTTSEILTKAISAKNKAVITSLLEKGEVDIINKIFKYACENTDLEILAKCFNNSIEQKKKNKQLAKASKCGNIALINLLLDNGAEINSVSKIGWGEEITPLRIAARNSKTSSNIETVKLLLDRGAEIDCVSGDWTPFISCCYNLGSNCSLETIKLLLDNGANVNWTRKNGYTGLMFMCEYVNNEEDKVKGINLLLEHGADALMKNDSGYDAIQLSGTYKYLFAKYEEDKSQKFYMGISSPVKLTIKFPKLQELEKNGSYFYGFEIKSNDKIVYKLPIEKQAVLLGLQTGAEIFLIIM